MELVIGIATDAPAREIGISVEEIAPSAPRAARVRVWAETSEGGVKLAVRVIGPDGRSEEIRLYKFDDAGEFRLL